MNENPHFATAASWKAARAMLTFAPLLPTHTAGLRLQALRIHVRDHKMRDLAPGERSLEAHYGGFTVSQAHKGAAEARRLALLVSYGREGHDMLVAGHPGRVYELGPQPPPDDIDGRSPAVVVWHDGGLLLLVASDTMSADKVARIAVSLYAVPRRRGR